MKRGEVIVALLVGITLIGAGFALLTSRHEAIVASGQAGRVYLGVDITKLRGGPIEAVRENPGKAVLISVAAAAAGAAVQRIGKSDETVHVIVTDERTIVEKQ